MELFSKIKSKVKSTVNKVKSAAYGTIGKLASSAQKAAPKASTAVKSTVSKLATVSKPKTTSPSSNSSKSSSSKSSSSKSSGSSSSLLQKLSSAVVPNVSADTSSSTNSLSKNYTPSTPGWTGLTEFLNAFGIDATTGQAAYNLKIAGKNIPINLPDFGVGEGSAIKRGALQQSDLANTNFGYKSGVGTGLPVTDKYKQYDLAVQRTIANDPNLIDEYKVDPNTTYIKAAKIAYDSGTLDSGGINTLSGDSPTGTGVLDPGTYSVTDAKTGEEVLGSLKEGASEEQVAQINALIAEYDKQQALNQNQLAYLGNQRQTALDTYGNQNKELMNQIATAKTNAERDVETGTQSLYETAQGTQRSNRNVLRALGILGSSAAGEMLTKPNTEAAKQVGNLQTQLVQRKKELDDLAIQKQNEYAVNVKELEDNYAKLVSDIQIDSRYTEDEKLAAIQNVNAAYSTRAAELDQAMLQWNQDMQTQAQQYALDIARMQAYQGITPDYTSLYNSKVSA